jgi:hypothetical protein
MHDTISRLVTTPHAAFVTEALMQSLGMLVVALVGALMLAGLLRRLLFKSVVEGGAGLDRRFLTDPRPADALECQRASKLVALYRR